MGFLGRMRAAGSILSRVRRREGKGNFLSTGSKKRRLAELGPSIQGQAPLGHKLFYCREKGRSGKGLKKGAVPAWLKGVRW